jgi:hypothetical protein
VRLSQRGAPEWRPAAQIPTELPELREEGLEARWQVPDCPERVAGATILLGHHRGPLEGRFAVLRCTQVPHHPGPLVVVLLLLLLLAPVLLAGVVLARLELLELLLCVRRLQLVAAITWPSGRFAVVLLHRASVAAVHRG